LSADGKYTPTWAGAASARWGKHAEQRRWRRNAADAADEGQRQSRFSIARLMEGSTLTRQAITKYLWRPWTPASSGALVGDANPESGPK